MCCLSTRKSQCFTHLIPRIISGDDRNIMGLHAEQLDEPPEFVPKLSSTFLLGISTADKSKDKKQMWGVKKL